MPVPHSVNATGFSCHFRVVGDKHNGLTAGVHFLEQADDLGSGIRVEVPRWLVSQKKLRLGGDAFIPFQRVEQDLRGKRMARAALAWAPASMKWGTASRKRPASQSISPAAR